MIHIDHMVIRTQDIKKTEEFYQDILGFQSRGKNGPFTTLEINHNSIIDLRETNEPYRYHLAFSMSKEAFNEIHHRLHDKKIKHYNDPQDTITSSGSSENCEAIGRSPGAAQGTTNSIYFRTPDQYHHLEIIYYDSIDPISLI